MTTIHGEPSADSVTIRIKFSHKKASIEDSILTAFSGLQVIFTCADSRFPAGKPVSVSAAVLDAAGNPVANRTVYFSGLAADTALTNGDGIATVVVQGAANTTSSIIATTSNLADTLLATFTADEISPLDASCPGCILAVSCLEDTLRRAGTDSSRVTATLTDSVHRPVADFHVSLAATKGSILPGGYTDSTGRVFSVIYLTNQYGPGILSAYLTASPSLTSSTTVYFDSLTASAAPPDTSSL